jgi:GST-like protein
MASERDQALRGLVFIAANCYPAIGVFDHPERWLPKGGELMLERLRRGARARLHTHWELFADLFPTPAAFHGGDAPGALDLLAAVVSQWCGARAHLRKRRPELAALLERVENHPGVAPVFARHWPPDPPGDN